MKIGVGLKSIKVVEITVEQQPGQTFLATLEDSVRMCLDNQDADVVVHYDDGKRARLSYWELIEHILADNGIPCYPSRASKEVSLSED